MGKKRKSQINSETDEVVDSKRKEKKLKHINDKNVESNEDPHATADISQSVKRSSNTTNSSKPKKIIFVDDQPQEVPVEEGNRRSKRQKNKPGQSGSQESNNDILREEDVKDEDIDKFCDELNEEDNKQYEDWVRLIEANLSSNKKKAK